MGWSTAFRRKGPAEAGTPTSQIKIEKSLAIDSTKGREAGEPYPARLRPAACGRGLLLSDRKDVLVNSTGRY